MSHGFVPTVSRIRRLVKHRPYLLLLPESDLLHKESAGLSNADAANVINQEVPIVWSLARAAGLIFIFRRAGLLLVPHQQLQRLSFVLLVALRWRSDRKKMNASEQTESGKSLKPIKMRGTIPQTTMHRVLEG